METEFKVPSSDGKHILCGRVYLPCGDAKAFFHVVHGMTEHIDRYEKFMREMAENGYICFGYDHLGHGSTAYDESELGFIASKDGYDLLCRDVKIFSDAVMAKYGEGKTLPYYLMGHSMGSFVTRLAAEKYVKPDKYVIMGTGGKNSAAGAGLALISLIKLIKGERYVSPLIYKLAFGSYNKRFGGGSKDDPSPWLTNDANVRKRYYADPYCNFKFTVSAMGDLIRAMKYSNRGAWFKNMRKELPVLLVSGENDPVGGYGKGIKQVVSRLQKNGCSARYILYPDARHEILNDKMYETVKNDILDFLNE